MRDCTVRTAIKTFARNCRKPTRSILMILGNLLLIFKNKTLSELFLGRIYVDSIEEGRLQTDSHDRKFAKIAIIYLDEKDEHGNDIIIQHRGSKKECNHIVIGNAQYQNPINFVPRKPLVSKVDKLIESDED
jgi:hypothetical protein